MERHENLQVLGQATSHEGHLWATSRSVQQVWVWVVGGGLT
jgi:hypothetical protein